MVSFLITVTLIAIFCGIIFYTIKYYRNRGALIVLSDKDHDNSNLGETRE